VNDDAHVHAVRSAPPATARVMFGVVVLRSPYWHLGGCPKQLIVLSFHRLDALWLRSAAGCGWMTI